MTAGMEPRTKEWLTTEEVCQALSMTVKEFRHYLRTKVFPIGIRRGRRRVWPAGEVEILKWLEQNQHRWGKLSGENQPLVKSKD